MFIRVNCYDPLNSWNQANGTILEAEKATVANLPQMKESKIEEPLQHFMIPVTEFNNKAMEKLYNSTAHSFFNYIYKQGGMCIHSKFCAAVSNQESSAKMRKEGLI